MTIVANIQTTVDEHTETSAVVVNITNEANGVVSLDLASSDNAELPEWEPGAHIDLILAPGLERQYSLCGNPHDRQRWRIAVLREPESRGGSKEVHERLRVGDQVRYRGPRNNFALIEEREYLFIAGGIGITPILPMIAQCEAVGSPWRLVYGGRNASSMAFTDTLREYGERVTIWPQDRFGHIDLDALLNEPSQGLAIYCCGPGVLLDAVESRFERWPAQTGTLHVERFRPRAGALEGRNTAFEVFLDCSDLEIMVSADQSILNAIEAAGVHVPTSCREGTCGTCETVVLDGTPEHRDSFLTQQEKELNEVMMPCCSRSLGSRLVLDL